MKFYSKPPIPDPVIMGHENIGIIAKAGKTFQKRRGLKEGDRIVLVTTEGAAVSGTGDEEEGSANVLEMLGMPSGPGGRGGSGGPPPGP